MQRTSEAASEGEKERLVKFFGEAGASVILKHLDNLDEAFGTASQIISQIMRGDFEFGGKSKDN